VGNETHGRTEQTWDGTMKRLFAVKHRTNNKKHQIDGEVVYFEKKQDAKILRNELNGEKSDKYFICRGPDHWKPEQVTKAFWKKK